MRSPFVKRIVFNRFVIAVLLVVVLPVVASAWFYKEWKSGVVWPEPPVVTPGENGSPPSDAIVLFDGTNTDQWKGAQKWLSDDGVLIATKPRIVAVRNRRPYRAATRQQRHLFRRQQIRSPGVRFF